MVWAKINSLLGSGSMSPGLGRAGVRHQMAMQSVWHYLHISLPLNFIELESDDSTQLLGG